MHLIINYLLFLKQYLPNHVKSINHRLEKLINEFKNKNLNTALNTQQYESMSNTNGFQN